MSGRRRPLNDDERALLALLALEEEFRQEGAQSAPTTWAAIARANQIPPLGDWRTWLILAGRGWGKTTTGAETTAGSARDGTARRIAVVARTEAELRDVAMAALRRAAGPGVEYFESRHLIRWPNGAWARGFSAEEPDSLRGYEFDWAWSDELAAWGNPDAFHQLQFALRVGRACQIVTTTPRPMALLRQILADPRTVITRGRTMDNAANLSPDALRYFLDRYGGTRLGRQELDAELLDDIEGALWHRDQLDALRRQEAPELVRVVVAIDPAVSSGEGADETAIVVVGKGEDGQGYLLADLSGRFSPDGWARRAVEAYHRWSADRVVAEVNQGGDLVEATLRTVDPTVPYTAVHASRGKRTRAEPIAALYEQRRVHHVGFFPELEDQLCTALPEGGTGPDDRLDALVWGLTELAFGTSDWDNPGAIPYAYGVWPCACGQLFFWQPGRACPRCGVASPAKYDKRVGQGG